MNHLKKYWFFVVVIFAFFIFFKPAICFLILGLLVFLTGLYSLYFFYEIKKNGIQVTAKILLYESDKDGYKVPIITFTTLNGKEIKGTPYFYVATDLSKIKNYKKKSVLVTYIPNSPKKFILTNEFKFNYISLIFIILIGLVFLGVSIFNLFGYININS